MAALAKGLAEEPGRLVFAREEAHFIRADLREARKLLPRRVAVLAVSLIIAIGWLLLGDAVGTWFVVAGLVAVPAGLYVAVAGVFRAYSRLEEARQRYDSHRDFLKRYRRSPEEFYQS